MSASHHERRRVWLIGPPRGARGAVDWVQAARVACRLQFAEGIAREISYAYRAAGREPPEAGLAPVSAPHSSVVASQLTGALDHHRWTPGALALAHGGVLFLSDATEFKLSCIQAVESALSWGWVRLSSRPSPAVQTNSSDWNSLTVPTWFSIVVHTLPCPCGNRGVQTAPCLCSDRQIEKFHEPVRQLVEGAEVVRL